MLLRKPSAYECPACPLVPLSLIHWHRHPCYGHWNGGAVFFSPLFMIVLGLKPHTAVGAALLTELFGFASGPYAYVRSKLIDYTIGLNLKNMVSDLPY